MPDGPLLNSSHRRDITIPWLVLGLVLMVLGGFIAYAQGVEYRRIGEWERERVLHQARIAEQSVVRQLGGIRSALEGIRADIPHWQQKGEKWERASQRLSAMSDAMPAVRTFIIMDAKGTVTAANRAPLIGQNFHYREYFKTPRSNPNPGLLYVSAPFTTPAGLTVINLTLTLLDASGRFDGIVSATISPEFFKLILGSVLYAPDMWIALTHGSGGLILESFQKQELSGKIHASSPALFLRHRESGLTNSYLLDKDPAGNEQMVVQHTVKPGDIRMDIPLVLAVTRGMSVPFDEWRTDTRIISTLFAGFAAAMGAGLFLFQRRQESFRRRTMDYEEQLRQHAELFHKIACQVPGAIFQFRLHPDGSSDIPYASEAICSLFHVTLDDVRFSASGVFAAIHAEDREPVLASIRESAENLTMWDFQFRVAHNDEPPRWLHATSSPQRNEENDILWHGFVTDITARKQDEVALRSNERFLSTLTDVIPGLLSYWNTELVCTFANKEYEFWFGKSQGEMIGLHLRDLLGDDLFLMDEPYISDALKGQGSRFERVLITADGVSRNIWINYMPDIDGEVARGFYVLATDVTELKSAQIKLEELNEELKFRTEEAELASRSKSRFLEIIAHEFRTPLSLLTSSTDILDRYGDRLSADEQLQQHGHIRNAARQMAGLVDSVLTYNRTGSQNPRENLSSVDVPSFCLRLAEELKTACGTGQDFMVNIGDDCGTVTLNEQLFRRVLENLLSNAFRYTPTTGSVSLNVNRTGSGLLVVVQDSGIGIPEEDQQRIYEAFFRCGNVETRRGLGLGLSIVAEALSVMGGTVSAESAVGKGTAMRVEIPYADVPDRREV